MNKSGLRFDLSFAVPRGTHPRDDTDPFRILILGGFSGKAEVPLAQRRPIGVDIDTLEQVFARLAPRIALTLGGEPLTIELHSLDDFHPDRLFARFAPFGALRQLRAEILDPTQFRRAAAALGAAPKSAAAATTETAREDTGADLERLLGRQPTAATTTAGTVDLSGWLRELVGQQSVPDIADEQQALLAMVDAALGELMRRVLHDPAFQSLEARWRGVERLVRDLELGESLHLFLLDAARDELAYDLQTHAADLSRSALHGHLCGPQTEAPDGKRWSLLAADLSFGADLDELQLLAALGALAGRAGAPLLAAATPSLLGATAVDQMIDSRTWQPLDTDTAAFWQALRQSPMAPWIGLALPRILLRQPYGTHSDPITAFAFEELPVREHAGYLWGNPAFGLALLAAQAFTESGWDMDLDAGLDIGDLPSHIYREDGEPHQQPCAEVAMGESAGTALLGQGLIPLLSYRNRNAVRLLRWQSIADPAQPLRGAWVGIARP
ncbi:type VI secretion system contractile sheath large subunit [uncultured Lamprocystis sp.]|jgi:type VI secretion system protein ImpC|uniref:type VI secretion system contractile sheath domain-containing protein n=1 Tax=uncultured Lamprocystis sp. TaxID=543132 RepID=UPI0025FD1375|nr:type VI secretion system contractile sheath large subunit [uncultured Lamprocystis sp.]